ncbi:YxeA family protein [Lacticaseibacillus pantheris]|jgi:uncharacterized protein (TIGR01655 family)|uniref:YxeA family protein n=1 Tax=Lacticaseibacillus pantheris DSM 15945 = JCM 12539 = NBRC 106106 TaxID=1423783 RepID=A0A0R1TW65_9LACO|nr:YxeA family protein [Lacticaseibacillus pantheris]KRL85577.1 hypothetical protein FC50_GL001750 [Lacticaseibacillus pantheris DSM 15945 = JCM 12539 = NBRC 106106]
MKKLLIGLIAFLLVTVGGLKIYEEVNYGGPSYYTQVTTDGKRFVDKGDNGQEYVDYNYVLTGYDDKGTAQKLTFNGNKARPLHRNAYLKLTYNQKKGVTKWEAVAKSAVPAKALTKLNK